MSELSLSTVFMDQHQSGSGYTYSIVGFVLVLGLLLAAIIAVFTACICCGHCKTHPSTAARRPSILPSPVATTTGTKTNSDSRLPTSPQQPRPQRHHFTLPPVTSSSSTPNTPSSSRTPGNNTVLHLRQLPLLASPESHSSQHSRRRPSLPPLSSTHAPIHVGRCFSRHQQYDAERQHPLHFRQHSLKTTDGSDSVSREIPLDAGGGNWMSSKTPKSAGILQSSNTFPPPGPYLQPQAGTAQPDSDNVHIHLSTEIKEEDKGASPCSNETSSSSCSQAQLASSAVPCVHESVLHMTQSSTKQATSLPSNCTVTCV